MSYRIGDATIGLEGRYNSDRISYKSLNEVFGPTGTQTFDRFLPRLTVDYRLTPDVMPYIIVAEGNHPGTFTTSTNPAVSTPVPVKEETLLDYEAGVKSEFLQHRLRVNVAAYHEIWQNQQLLENALYFVALTQNYQRSEVLTNAGRSHIDGFEFEIDALPMTRLDLRGTLAYDRAVFDSFCSPQYYGITGVGNAQLGCRSVAGKILPQQPPLTASLIASYEAPLGSEWNLFSITEYSFLDRKYSDETNLSWTPHSNLVNIHLGLHTDAFRGELLVMNLTQENSPVRSSTRLDYQLLTSRYGDYNTDEVPQKPRQFGVKLTYKLH
jgi:iron complex outermembrane receptor protein